MDFSQLNFLIQQIKEKIRCPHCRKRFSDPDIQIMDTGSQEGLFLTTCPRCGEETVLDLALSSKLEISLKFIGSPRKRVHRSLHSRPPSRKSRSEKTRFSSNVTVNDVLDTHNFLKNFNGDFSKIFIPQK